MTKYTAKGLEARRDAELTGKPIILKTFKVCDEEIEDFENATIEDLPSFWIEKPITYFTSIGQTGLQFECRVLQEEATHQGRYFALYLENGDCYLVSQAPGVFNANIEQRFRIKRDFINNNTATYDCTFIDKIQVSWEDVLNKPELYTKEEIDSLDYNGFTEPAINTNPKDIGNFYKNKTTGELFVCTDNTPDKNRWIGQLGTVVAYFAIATPTDFTVEGSPSDVTKNPTITLNSLPTAMDATIDAVEFRVLKKADNSLVGSVQSTTNLTLPIIFTSPDLEVATEYYFEIRCRDVASGFDGGWGSVVATTIQNFLPSHDPLGDGSNIATWLNMSDLSDLSGNYNGIAVGTIDFSGGVANLDESTDAYIRMPDPAPLTGLNDFTISMCIEPKQANLQFLPLYTQQSKSTTGAGIYIYMQDGNFSVKGVIVDSNTSELSESRKYHIAIIREGTTLRIIVDGERELTDTITDATIDDNDAYSGFGMYTVTATSDCKFGVNRIFNRALTLEEVQSIKNMDLG